MFRRLASSAKGAPLSRAFFTRPRHAMYQALPCALLSQSYSTPSLNPKKEWNNGEEQKKGEKINLPYLIYSSSLILVGFLASGAYDGYKNRQSAEGPSIQYADQAGMLTAANDICSVLGEDSVSFDSDVIEHHGHSSWSTSNSAGRPVAVVYPKSTEQVSQIASICHSHNVPMIPFGAGSSVEGNFSSPYSGICIDFTYMDKIVAFHPEDMDVVVQPGVNWMDLNAKIKDESLFLPLDPSPTAMIGG
jgi:D-lactate dehydrogenase (cytochrome)